MSNYNLVIDTSNFKPFDIGPALQVLHDYRDAYYKYEDQMNKIAEEKGQYILPDTPENQEYRGIMDRYNNDYNAAVEDFSRGMNLANANMIRDIRRRYFNEVTPINKAIEAYNKDQDKMTALGADAIIANQKRSIRDYYGGLNPGIRYQSDKAIQATAANVMQGLNNALMSAPELAGSIANQYFKLKQEGINGEKALNTILKINPQLNSQEGISDTSQLLDALDRVYQNYAFENGTPENEKIWKSVVSGALQGIQAPKYDLKADQNFENAATRAQRLHAEAATAHTIETTRHLRNQMAQEEEENNLQFGRVYNPATKRYEENIPKAQELLEMRKAASKKSGGDSKPPTPYVEYGGHKYNVKVTRSDIQDDIYDIHDIETGEIVTDPNLKQSIQDKYEGKAIPEPAVPASPKPKPAPSDSKNKNSQSSPAPKKGLGGAR